jgi:voltage-gated potassium channel
VRHAPRPKLSCLTALQPSSAAWKRLSIAQELDDQSDMTLTPASQHWRETASRRYRDLVELPLLLLAVALIPLLLTPLVFQLNDAAERILVAVDWFIWALFAADYLIGLALAPRRWRYIRTKWAGLLLVVLPFLRPLRIVRSARAVRLLRLTRVVAALSRTRQAARRLLVAHQLHYVLLTSLVLVVACATLVYALEADHGGPIDSFPQALWWAITTVTTVGYGDAVPVTAPGRGVAAFLVITGIALFGVVTANLAAFLVKTEPDPAAKADLAHAELLARLDDMTARLAAVEQPNRR